MYDSPGHKARLVIALLLLAGLQGVGGCMAGDLFTRSQGAADPLAAVTAPVIGPRTGQAVAGSIARSTPPLLVVITYGNGWSAASSGSGLRAVASTIRRLFPNEEVITRGCDDADGIRQTIEAHRGPVALVGHSFGGCRTVEIAGSVRRPIDWVILLDPVPCDDWAFPHPGKYFRLPASVRHATCFYRGAGMFPISYPISSPAATSENRLRPMGHSEFCQDAEVRTCILEVCARAEAGQFTDVPRGPVALGN